MMQKGCLLCKLSALRVIVGALNWGLVGLLHKNLVHRLVGSIPKAERIVYILVGIAGLLKLITCFKACPCGACSTKKA